MIPYEVDPSLHSTKPHEPVLDDGFSRPESKDEVRLVKQEREKAHGEPQLPKKSDF